MLLILTPAAPGQLARLTHVARSDLSSNFSLDRPKVCREQRAGDRRKGFAIRASSKMMMCRRGPDGLGWTVRHRLGASAPLSVFTDLPALLVTKTLPHLPLFSSMSNSQPTGYFCAPANTMVCKKHFNKNFIT